jgi:hypothetical protein
MRVLELCTIPLLLMNSTNGVNSAANTDIKAHHDVLS